MLLRDILSLSKEDLKKYGYVNWPKRLLSKPQGINEDGNTKFKKRRAGEEHYYISALSLAPHTTVPQFNNCSHATQECFKYCLYSTGRGNITKVQIARINKSIAFNIDKHKFIAQLKKEIREYSKLYSPQNLAIRLNVFSDIVWERLAPSIFSDFSNIQFYDYTKVPNRIGNTPKNYHLTFSYSEHNIKTSHELLVNKKCNVAMIYNATLSINIDSVSRSIIQFPHIGEMRLLTTNGDLSDLRFLDTPASGGIVYLKAKGKFIHHKSNSIVKVEMK